MLSGASWDRLLKMTWRLVITWPAGTLTVIVDGYGLAVPLDGMVIGLRLLKSVGTVRSSRRKSEKSDRRKGVRRGAARRSAFLFFVCRRLMGIPPEVSR